MPPQGGDHLVLGHEAVAEVLDTGPDVTLVKKGMLVVPTVRRPCPHPWCRPCRAGRQDFCVTGDFTERGIKGQDGFLQSFVVEEEDNLIVVPKQLTDVAVLTEPMTVAAKAWKQGEGIQARLPWDRPRLRALALGAGPVGLLGALGMVINDYETFVYSLEPATSPRAKLTRDMGATYVSGQDVPLEKLAKELGALDVIDEAVGVSSVAFSALSALGPNGIFVFTAVPALGEPQSIQTDRLMRQLVLQNQVVMGTVNASRRDFATAFHFLEQGMLLFPAAVRAIITERAPIDGAPRIISKREGIKQVVHLADPSPS